MIQVVALRRRPYRPWWGVWTVTHNPGWYTGYTSVWAGWLELRYCRGVTNAPFWAREP